MAFVGMRHPVVATVATEVAGQALTYNAGMVMGHAIMGNLTITRNQNPLRGDDVEVENDNSITGMSIEMGLDDIMEAVRVYMLGLEVVNGETNQWNETAAPAPYVGFGYIRVRKKNGITFYQAIWCHKAQFGQTAENSATKGETIEWQTPTLTGRVMGVYNSSGNEPSFRHIALFATEADAIAWLNTKANMSGGMATITVASAQGSTSGTTKLTISGYTPGDGEHYVVKHASGTAPAIDFGAVPDYTWTAWDGSADITATNGNKITVASINAAGEAVASGNATIVARA